MLYEKILFLLLFCWVNLLPAQNKTENVFLITLDGFRWQELYEGVTDSLMNDLLYVRDTATLQKKFDAPTAEARREKLMPFFWKHIVKNGQLYGNRLHGNKVNCTNKFWFSYPGYHEILSGFADDDITSNDKIPNKNKTVLEWINEQPGYEGRVAAFCSWDVFPYIINEERSGIPVNAGFDLAKADNLNEKEKFLNELQPTIPSPWSSVRLDAFTHNYAVEYIKKNHPKLVYIAYGETDDFAHDGRYDHYLNSAHQTDQWIKALWELAQSDPVYKNKTTFIITTDHGRGTNPKRSWKDHGRSTSYGNIKGTIGSDQIWIAAMGPDTPALGEVKKDQQLYQNQVAKTCAALLGLDYNNTRTVGKAIKEIITN